MRVLASAALAFSAAIFAANYILKLSALPVLAGVLLLCGLLLIIPRRLWLRGIVAGLISAGLGLGWFYGHYMLTTRPAHAVDGTEAEIHGRVLDYPTVYDDYCRLRIKSEGEGISGLEALVYDSSMTLAEAEAGDIVSFYGAIRSADVKYGEEYDYYNSRDIYLVINTRSDVKLTDGGNYIPALPAKLNHAIGETICRLFPADTRAFMRSLMLGDKTELYQDEGLHLAMTRSGFMHTVAVSGMHIAFLVGLLQLLMGANRRSSLICIVLVWLFVLTTGSTHSAVRAGIMQTVLLLAPILRRENDPPTSLSFALALILLINPYAAASVGLQLSFGAMAGIMCFSQRFNEAFTAKLPDSRLGSFLRGILGTAASSLAVMVFTIPLIAIHFGYIQLLSPITNVLALWAVSLCFCGGYIACAIGAIIPAVGTAAAWLVSWLARYIFLVCRVISSAPFAIIYISSAAFVVWLVVSYLLFGIWAMAKGRARRFFIPAAMSALLLAACFGLTRRSYQAEKGVFAALDVGQGQCLTVTAGESAVMIDCGSTGSLENAGDIAAEFLSARGVDNIDLLLLTHLHADHANGVVRLMETVKVDKIIMPIDPDDDDGLLGAILSSAEKQATDVLFLSRDISFTVGDIALRVFAPTEEGDINERCICAVLSIDDYDMLVTGDSPKSVERELVDDNNLSGIELYIAGHHGSRYSSCGELLNELGGETAIISVGYNTYGHPTYETLERLAAYGYNIYRTDLNGTIEIRIG